MGRPLHLILLALHTNLGEAQAKLDAIAAARTRGDSEPPGPCITVARWSPQRKWSVHEHQNQNNAGIKFI
jgi:hypothetical protein